jgi:hypothetical protein
VAAAEERELCAVCGQEIEPQRLDPCYARVSSRDNVFGLTFHLHADCLRKMVDPEGKYDVWNVDN